MEGKMKLTSMLSLLVAASGLIAINAKATASADYYSIKTVVIKELPDTDKVKFMSDAVGNFTEGCSPDAANSNALNPVKSADTSPSVDPLDVIDVIVDKIINIGKKIWAIVDAGRPVVNVKMDTANALPAGVRCWNELEGWQAPVSKLYQAQYQNAFGANVVTYAFRVSFIAGGSYKGQGQYLTMATIQPANIDVSWGFRFDANATIPMVFNQGSKANPLAGMQMVSNWQVTSPLEQTQRAENFFINGAGTLEKLK
jgi:hypothetical protein